MAIDQGIVVIYLVHDNRSGNCWSL